MKKIRLNNPWLEMWFRHYCSNQLAADTMTRNIDTLLMHGEQTLVDHCLPPSKESRNPLEFHGRRSREPLPVS